VIGGLLLVSRRTTLLGEEADFILVSRGFHWINDGPVM